MQYIIDAIIVANAAAVGVLHSYLEIKAFSFPDLYGLIMGCYTPPIPFFNNSRNLGDSV